MRLKTLGIVVLALVTASVLPAQEQNKDGKKDEKILGTWKMVSGEKGGEKAPEEFVEKFRLTFKKDGKFSVEMSDRDIEGTYKLDPGKKPPHFNVDADGKNLEGIYALDGDDLKLCIDEAGKRPTEFVSPGGSHTMLFILKRAPK